MKEKNDDQDKQILIVKQTRGTDRKLRKWTHRPKSILKKEDVDCRPVEIETIETAQNTFRHTKV